MLEENIAYCKRRISEEEQKARRATTDDARERHQQAAMLYRAELALLERRRTASDGSVEFADGP